MGYQLQSVHSIRPDDRHEYFVYLIESAYNSSLQKWFDRHFSQIAHDLGLAKGVIVRGLDRHRFSSEIHQLVHGSDVSGPFRTALYGKNYEYYTTPYYLVSNRPPGRFADRGCVLLLLPLLDIPSDYFLEIQECRPQANRARYSSLYVEAVTRVVVGAIKSGDLGVLAERAILGKGKIRRVSAVTILRDAVQIRPSIFGVLEVDVRRLVALLWAKWRAGAEKAGDETAKTRKSRRKGRH